VKTMTCSEVKKNFEAVLIQAQDEPIEIQKNGKSIAVLMSYDSYKKLEKMKLELFELRDRAE
jgi:antitoxin Phd